MIQYVFFDLDGTLTDPGRGITNSVAYALRHFGIEVSDRAELYRFIGPPLLESFRKFYGFTAEQAEEALRLYREYFAPEGIYENEVYPGIPALLKRLQDAGKTLVLATSKPDQFSIEILKHFELYPYFSFCACATMDEKRTKKAEVIRYALDSLNIRELSACVMVGDREHDIFGAKETGVRSIGVTYGYGSPEELTEAGADFLAENPEEIRKIIMKL